MKQIFDWLRGQVSEKILPKVPVTSIEQCVRASCYNKMLAVIDEAEAKWESEDIPIIHGKAELELHDKVVRAKAIDEFAEKLKAELNQYDFWKYSIVTDLGIMEKDVPRDWMIDEIADQLKEHSRKLNRCDTCNHYVADEVPPICYFCCKGMEDNYQQKGE